MPRHGTQAHAVLKQLEIAPAGICSLTFKFHNGDGFVFVRRIADPVHKLRKKGWRIGTRPCRNPSHEHEVDIIEYYLEDE